MRARMRSFRCLCAVMDCSIRGRAAGPHAPMPLRQAMESPTSARRSRGQPSPSPPRGRVAWRPGQGVGRETPPTRLYQPATTALRLVDPLLQQDGHGVTGLLADRPADLRLDGQLVRAVAQGHEGALERVAVDRPPDLDE